MKKIIIITGFLLLLIPFARAQTYKLINDVLVGNNSDKIYLRNTFEPLAKGVQVDIPKYLNKRFFEDNWSPLPSKNTPDIKMFLKNFDLEHLNTISKTHNKKEIIDFKKLNSNVFIKIKDVKKHLKSKQNYQVISKPIFNCSHEWAVIYRYSVFNTDVGNSGALFLYRKTEKGWVQYHSLNLWVN